MSRPEGASKDTLTLADPSDSRKVDEARSNPITGGSSSSTTVRVLVASKPGSPLTKSPKLNSMVSSASSNRSSTRDRFKFAVRLPAGKSTVPGTPEKSPGVLAVPPTTNGTETSSPETAERVREIVVEPLLSAKGPPGRANSTVGVASSSIRVKVWADATPKSAPIGTERLTITVSSSSSITSSRRVTGISNPRLPAGTKTAADNPE